MSPIEGPSWPGQPVFQIVSQVLEIAWWLLGARLGIMLLDVVFMRKTWHRERLFQELLGAIVFVAALVAAIAYVLHWPVRGLIATSGALAIIIGLAVQSTLSDVFSGLVINTTQPYQPGDWIMVDGIEGSVVEMNWRATHILNAKGNTVVVPNNVAAKAKITNVSRPAALHGRNGLARGHARGAAQACDRRARARGGELPARARRPRAVRARDPRGHRFDYL